MSNFIVNTDIPNLRVIIREADKYNVNIIPGRITTLRSGSINTIADLAFSAISSSYSLTASYAENVSDIAAFPYSGSAIITGSLQVTDDVSVNNSVTSNEYKLTAGNVTISFTGSINSGVFGATEDVRPYISTADYSGTIIEYVAQRPGATRIGTVLATWSGSNVVFTDVSSADIGDTNDISFAFIQSGSFFKLRVNSGGSGSGAWTVQSLFKLFPNLNS